LNEIESRTPLLHLPVISGHQVVVLVEAVSSRANSFSIRDWVGIAWIYSTRETFNFCLAGTENLCLYFKTSGKDADGG